MPPTNALHPAHSEKKNIEWIKVYAKTKESEVEVEVRIGMPALEGLSDSHSTSDQNESKQYENPIRNTPAIAKSSFDHILVIDQWSRDLNLLWIIWYSGDSEQWNQWQM